jgi:hypothetical protein
MIGFGASTGRLVGEQSRVAVVRECMGRYVYFSLNVRCIKPFNMFGSVADRLS